MPALLSCEASIDTHPHCPVRSAPPVTPTTCTLKQLPPAAACMKHFIGYGNSRIGHDRGPVVATDRDLRNHYLPAFREAVRAGVKTAMRCGLH